MQALQLHLQREAEANPQASYYNVGIIKYQVAQTRFLPLLVPLWALRGVGKSTRPSPQLSSQDPGRAPLLLSAECQRSGTVTRVSLDYHCCPATAPSTQLTNVQVLLPLDHTATDLQCQPPASWSAKALFPCRHSESTFSQCFIESMNKRRNSIF